LSHLGSAEGKAVFLCLKLGDPLSPPPFPIAFSS
jgi:hypothetical protein